MTTMNEERAGYMPIPTAEQVAEALANVRCFHDLSAEIIAPELLKNLLAAAPEHPARQGEAVEVAQVVSYLSACADGYDPDAPHPGPPEPLMTVAQHNRILAARVPAGCKVVPVELLELLREMADLHERRGTVLTVHMEQLRALLASAEGVKDE